SLSRVTYFFPTKPSSSFPLQRCSQEWQCHPFSTMGMGKPRKRPAARMFFLNSSQETSREPHEGQCGCSYSPTPSTSNFAGERSSRIFLASSASLFLTTSFNPPNKLDQSQSSRTTVSSCR